eukprot:TRINITY_DN39459_c0_g1_i1.p1 TRINITY_DN39459_c0_g1~~TRINITY_DN39459_c0_g1_i1.p1  ORF type:complete len:609 (+),score=186.08 TRINITY_DN39459_c0_g1_i1:90-1916(+)
MAIATAQTTRGRPLVKGKLVADVKMTIKPNKDGGSSSSAAPVKLSINRPRAASAEVLAPTGAEAPARVPAAGAGASPASDKGARPEVSRSSVGGAPRLATAGRAGRQRLSSGGYPGSASPPAAEPGDRKVIDMHLAAGGEGPLEGASSSSTAAPPGTSSATSPRRSPRGSLASTADPKGVARGLSAASRHRLVGAKDEERVWAKGLSEAKRYEARERREQASESQRQQLESQRNYRRHDELSRRDDRWQKTEEAKLRRYLQLDERQRETRERVSARDGDRQAQRISLQRAAWRVAPTSPLSHSASDQSFCRGPRESPKAPLVTCLDIGERQVDQSLMEGLLSARAEREVVISEEAAAKEEARRARRLEEETLESERRVEAEKIRQERLERKQQELAKRQAYRQELLNKAQLRAEMRQRRASEEVEKARQDEVSREQQKWQREAELAEAKQAAILERRQREITFEEAKELREKEKDLQKLHEDLAKHSRELRERAAQEAKERFLEAERLRRKLEVDEKHARSKELRMEKAERERQEQAKAKFLRNSSPNFNFRSEEGDAALKAPAQGPKDGTTAAALSNIEALLSERRRQTEEALVEMHVSLLSDATTP